MTAMTYTRKLAISEAIMKVCMIAAIVFAVCTIGSISVRSCYAIRYDLNTTSAIRVAAINNDPIIATQELSKVISQAEKNGWTSGYTSAFWIEDDENLGLWYQGMVASRDRIQAIQSVETSKLDVATTLGSIQSSFKKHGGGINDGPEGISVYPYNRLFAIVHLSFFGLFLLSLLGSYLSCSYDSRCGRH